MMHEAEWRRLKAVFTGVDLDFFAGDAESLTVWNIPWQTLIYAFGKRRANAVTGDGPWKFAVHRAALFDPFSKVYIYSVM
jgi:hypothetical protein